MNSNNSDGKEAENLSESKVSFKNIGCENGEILLRRNPKNNIGL